MVGWVSFDGRVFLAVVVEDEESVGVLEEDGENASAMDWSAAVHCGVDLDR